MKIYFTRCRINDKGNGGDRRAFQIFEYYDRCRCISINDQQIPALSLKPFILDTFSGKFDNTYNYLLSKEVQFEKEWKYWETSYQDSFLLNRLKSKNSIQKTEELSKATEIIVDDPIYTLPIIKHFRKLNIKVTGVIHNLESLVDGQVKPKYQLDLFRNEIECIGLCDEVITISREEDVLLKNLGINSKFIPYTPSAQIYDMLIRIKEARKKSDKKGLLMIGTVKNTPTRKGMLDFIRIYENKNYIKLYGPLTVGGFGMEKHFQKFEKEHVKVIRQLDDEMLEKLLEDTKAFVCYQEKGAGSLTKIAELLIAEVPILASEMAARSYYNHSLITII